MSIRNTKTWQQAEWDYAELHGRFAMPLLGNPPSLPEAIEWLEDIVKKCPRFYPALLDLGLRRLAAGDEARGKPDLEKGFRLMLDWSEKKHLEEEAEILIENLEKIWRFDLCQHYLAELVERFPKKASFRDSLAAAAARLGETEEALLHMRKALEMEPKNAGFLSDLGWIHLIAGNLDLAGKALREARDLRPDDEVVEGNLDIHQYLTEHGGSYFDFLVRPLDMDEIDRLADEEEWETVDRLCASYDSSREEAMALTFLKEGGRKCSRLSDLLGTLRLFFGFVDRIDEGGYWLKEDIGWLNDRFRPIMHKFIFKFSDIDRKLIEELWKALFEYYGFLAEHGMVTRDDLEEFKANSLGMKQELIAKATRYAKARHDPHLGAEEKGALAEELFEGDHDWPFL